MNGSLVTDECTADKQKCQKIIVIFFVFKINDLKVDVDHEKHRMTLTFWSAMAVVGLLGLYLVSRQWDTFLTTFAYIFTWQGVLTSLIALSLVKIAHEFGHAYTARQFGCHIPTMGVAFMVMWPILYTETSEVWKLPCRKQRLAVGAAGVAAELALAACATLAWSFLPDGPIRSAAFFLATVSWIFSLSFNLNPFMRFDGYYLLSDWLEVQNLHSRAFALGRWHLRKTLFGWTDPPPESLPAARQRFLIFFAYATWLYRLVLFVGIALLVYHLFLKVVGIVVMLVEIGVFIAMPIFSELRVWYQRRAAMRLNRSTLRTSFIGILLILAIIIPWRTDIAIPGVLQRVRHAVLYAPAPAQIETISVVEGDLVQDGQLLLRLASPDLEHTLKTTATKLLLYRWQLAFRSMNADMLERHLVVQQEMQTALSQQSGYLRRKEQLTLTAPFAGQIIELSENLQPGDWVAEKEALMTLADRDGWRVEGYINEADLGQVVPGAPAVFYPEGLDWPPLTCHLTLVERVNIKYLPEPALASIHGGGIAVRPAEQGVLAPEEGLYRIHLQLDQPVQDADQALRGTVILAGEVRSFISRFWQSVVMVVIQESAF